jgi:hypothetical protein
MDYNNVLRAHAEAMLAEDSGWLTQDEDSYKAETLAYSAGMLALAKELDYKLQPYLLTELHAVTWKAIADILILPEYMADDEETNALCEKAMNAKFREIVGQYIKE